MYVKILPIYLSVCFIGVDPHKEVLEVIYRNTDNTDSWPVQNKHVEYRPSVFYEDTSLSSLF